MPAVTNEDFLRAIFGAEVGRVHVTGFSADPGKTARGDWIGGYASEYPAAFLPGNNTFFTISLFTGARRTKDTHEGTYVIVIDDVGTKVPAEPVLAKLGRPSYVLETSTGNFQYGYMLSAPDPDGNRYDSLVKGMLSAGLAGPGGKDPGMAGVTRIVRMPIGTNTKAAYGPGGFKHILHEWEPARRFTMEKMAAGWGFSLPAPGTGAPVKRNHAKVDPKDDLILTVLTDLGMVKSLLPNGAGVDIVCPWIAEHTGGANTAAGYMFTGTFKCHHGHCIDRHRPELAAWLARALNDAGDPVRASYVREEVLPGLRQGPYSAARDFKDADKPVLGRFWSFLVCGLPAAATEIVELCQVADRKAVPELLRTAKALLGVNPAPYLAALRRERKRVAAAAQAAADRAKRDRVSRVVAMPPRPAALSVEKHLAEARQALAGMLR